MIKIMKLKLGKEKELTVGVIHFGSGSHEIDETSFLEAGLELERIRLPIGCIKRWPCYNETQNPDD